MLTQWLWSYGCNSHFFCKNGHFIDISWCFMLFSYRLIFFRKYCIYTFNPTTIRFVIPCSTRKMGYWTLYWNFSLGSGAPNATCVKIPYFMYFSLIFTVLRTSLISHYFVCTLFELHNNQKNNSDDHKGLRTGNLRCGATSGSSLMAVFTHF